MSRALHAFALAAALPAAAAAIPMTQQPAAPEPTGSLAIRAVQATQGGPPVGSADVKVRLLHQGVMLDELDTQLDEHGVVVLEGLSLRIGVQPLVQVHYSDLTFQALGDVLDAAHPSQTVEVECYESTGDPPGWSVPMWHVMVDRGPDGLAVTEIIVVRNPADRTWTGRPGPGGRESTTAFALPEGAEEVVLGRGFHDWCCTTRAGARLVNHLPLNPGATEFKFSYRVPGEAATELELLAPAGVERLMVLLPRDVELASAGGLAPMGAQAVGGREIAAYGAQALHEGAAVTLALGPAAAAQPAAPGAAIAVKVVAGLGGAVLLIATVVVLARPPRKTPDAEPAS